MSEIRRAFEARWSVDEIERRERNQDTGGWTEQQISDRWSQFGQARVGRQQIFLALSDEDLDLDYSEPTERVDLLIRFSRSDRSLTGAALAERARWLTEDLRRELG